MGRRKEWPDPADYNLAIQNPRNCFDDEDLKRGEIVTDRRGFPKGISGNFAVVYQVRNGSKEFAIKCFIRQVTNQQYRYKRLSNYITSRRAQLPMLVDFEYLERGIRVNAQLYPIVKMGWVRGNLLHQYIEGNLYNHRALRQLANEWKTIVEALRKNEMAHGDLQHGNIFVDAQERIRLVDYDGMFVPPLRDDPPEEYGHRNYQHPRRSSNQNYDENIDNFSNLVIYLSLLAVAAEPKLWNDFHYDENLILGEEDFNKPGRTRVWERLRNSPDAEVQRLTKILEKSCRSQVPRVPGLETILEKRPGEKTPTDWVVCSKGHIIKDPSFFRYCPVCGEAVYGRRTCLHCKRSIPDRASFCPQCGKPTGWR